MISIKRISGRVIQTLPAAAQRVPNQLRSINGATALVTPTGHFFSARVFIKRRRLTQEDLGQIRLWDAETHRLWQRYYQ